MRLYELITTSEGLNPSPELVGWCTSMCSSSWRILQNYYKWRL